MKKDAFKIVLLLLILLAIPLITVTNNGYRYYPDNFPDLPKDENWEFVKDRLFDGETSTFYKRGDSIMLVLENATKTDSLLVKQSIVEIMDIIPTKIIISERSVYDDIRKKWSFEVGNSIYLDFQVDNSKLNWARVSDYKSYAAGQHSSILRKELVRRDEQFYGSTQIKFSFKKGEIPDNYKEKLIRTHIMRSLCVYQNDVYEQQQRVQRSAESSVYSSKKKILATNISERDTFLLRKLYSPNFLKEFKTYMYKTYPWTYASNYLNKAQTKVFAIWVSLMLSITLILIGFSLFYKKKYAYLYLNYFIPLSFLMLSLFCVFMIYQFMTSKYAASKWIEVMLGYLVVLGSSSVMSFFLMLSDKYFVKKSIGIGLQIILKICFTFLICIAPIAVVFIAENKDVESWFRLSPVILIVFFISFGRGLLIYLHHYSDSLIKEKDVELSRLKELNAQNELKSLHAHINPHFLYNALNSIASLVYENPKKTEEMTISLSDLFKYSINRKGEKMSTIANEVEMVENYLKIEKIRFEERLNFSIDVEDGLLEKEIPMYVLQPLIENAIKHGISKIDVDGKIELELKMEDDKLLITVSDNGPDFPDGLLCGHGLQSVYDLLRLSYGELATMNWENAPEKRIVISITSNS